MNTPAITSEVARQAVNFHRFDRTRARLEAADVALHIFNHHDGIINHNPDREDKPEEGEHVNGKAKR